MCGSVWLLMLSGASAWGQRYPTARVRATADSVLRQRLGPALYAQTRYEANTYYCYRNWLGQEKTRVLAAHRNTIGHFLRVDVRYAARLSTRGCPAVDTIRGTAFVGLDEHLRLREAPYVAFIPDFMWQQAPCALLTREQALVIGRQAPLQQGLESPTASLSYDRATKAFTWEVYNYLTRRSDYTNRPTGNVEVVKIDAATGRIVHHGTQWYGTIR
ncbi:hypothetical protein GCM10027345_22740 [Hymenobacter daeguensis]